MLILRCIVQMLWIGDLDLLELQFVAAVLSRFTNTLLDLRSRWSLYLNSAILCYATLCMLCYATLCNAMQCRATVCFAAPCHAKPCMPCHICHILAICYALLCSSILRYTLGLAVKCYMMLSCGMLSCVVLC